MSECWQDTTPTPTGFPIFKDGKLLFCGGKLATTCCPTGYWYECGNDPWNPVSWESHGQEFHDPPCTAPTEWGGTWEIGATCFGGVCEGAERPLADIYVHGGNACDFSVAVLTEWGCKSVKIDLPSAPFSGTGTWTVWVEGVTMTMDVEVVEGQPFQYTMDLPEGQQNVFADEGRVEFRSRLTIQRQHHVCIFLRLDGFPRDRKTGHLPDNDDERATFNRNRRRTLHAKFHEALRKGAICDYRQGIGSVRRLSRRDRSVLRELCLRF
jgi:hypothetical protein